MKSYARRPLMADERKYTFRSCTDIEMRSGLIGYMQINMSYSTALPQKTWVTVNERLKSDSFKADFREIFSVIEKNYPDGESLRVYYNTHLKDDFVVDGDHYVGFRLSTSKYAYLIRVKPAGNTDNLIVYCYEQERFRYHLRNALNGIRFVDSKGRELFTVRDGESITLHPCSIDTAFCVRYIDPFNALIRNKKWNLLALAKYLEKTEKSVFPA